MRFLLRPASGTVLILILKAVGLGVMVAFLLAVGLVPNVQHIGIGI